MIARLICWLVGHKRGVRISLAGLGDSAEFCCPRCKATWERKIYARKGKA